MRNSSRVATQVWLALCAVNMIVWAAVSVISGSVDQPWFLWSVVGGGAVVTSLRLATRPHAPVRR